MYRWIKGNQELLVNKIEDPSDKEKIKNQLDKMFKEVAHVRAETSEHIPCRLRSQPPKGRKGSTGSFNGKSRSRSGAGGKDEGRRKSLYGGL